MLFGKSKDKYGIYDYKYGIFYFLVGACNSKPSWTLGLKRSFFVKNRGLQFSTPSKIL